MSHRIRSRRAAVAAALTTAALLSACSDPTPTDNGPAGGTSSPSKVNAQDAVRALVPAAMRTKGTITFATNAPYAPLEYFDTDNRTLIGYDIDLGNAVGAAMGLKVEWKNISFDSIIPGLQAGRYDVGMAGFSIEHERLGTVDFVSYYLSGGGFLIKKGSGKSVNSFNALCGLKVSVQKGVSQVDALTEASTECVKQGKSAIAIMQVPDQNVAVLNLDAGRADVVVADKPQVEYAAKQSGKTCVISTYQTSHSIAGIAVPKNQPDLSKALQAAINYLLKSGSYAQISQRWGTGVSVQGATLSADYKTLAATWGVGPDGTIISSKIFTKADEIRPGHQFFFQPVRSGCA